MLKKLSLCGGLLLTTGLLPAQTLFTYGPHTVSAASFLRAFNKNNNPAPGTRGKAIQSYLDLYINSRLKVQEAYDQRMDTLPNIVQEVNNLRAQISENFMSDPEYMKRLIREAFTRSQQDIRVAHIFLSFTNAAGVTDRAAADRKKEALLERLKKEDFGKLAAELSDDTSARSNKGVIGYVTVFSLPYAFENAIYATQPGGVSALVISKAGYHIFKNLGVRKAAGRIKAQQILLSIPPGSDDNAKARIRRLADSLYQRIMAGEDFGKLAAAFSHDYVTAAANGLMPETGVGEFDPAFEDALFALPKDGAVSRPFQTAHGWHLVKRVSRTPVVTNPADKNNLQQLEQKVKADARWKTSGDFIYNQVKAKPGIRRPDYAEAGLWAFSDSLLTQQPLRPEGRGWTTTTPVFAIGTTEYTVADWLNYANAYRFKSDGTGPKPWPQVREEFEQFQMTAYYREHLDDYSEEFRLQMQEFRDGNIFFEIMQQEVWNKAQADSAALEALFEKNKKNYYWKPSAGAVLFFCADEATARAVYDQVKKNPASWRTIAEGNPEKMVADSGRFEWSQLPNLNKMAPRVGQLTTPMVNKMDNSVVFALITQVFPQPGPRTLAEARGLVINDYQLVLEKQWNERLRQKYPVVIDRAVLAGISK